MYEHDNAPMIYGSMATILSKVGAIGKDQKNAAQNFKYRGIDDVYNAINPILAANQVFMTSEILEKTRQERTNKNGTVLAFTCLRMRYTFWAPDGSHVSTEVEGEGMDSGDKSSNKAMAVAHKYALLQAFCVPTQMDDPDAESHEVEPVQPSQPKQEQDPFLPTADEYVSTATTAIRDTSNSVDDLRAWWSDEAEMRRKVGLSQDHVDILKREMQQRANNQQGKAA